MAINNVRQNIIRPDFEILDCNEKTEEDCLELVREIGEKYERTTCDDETNTIAKFISKALLVESAYRTHGQGNALAQRCALLVYLTFSATNYLDGYTLGFLQMFERQPSAYNHTCLILFDRFKRVTIPIIQ